MTRGPTITYVTDPSLDVVEQRRAIGEFVNLSDDYRIRLAIRLPDASDDEIEQLLNWHLEVTSGRKMPPALIANRPAIAAKHSQVQSWLPSRYLGSESSADVYSVHEPSEAHSAIAAGAREVIYGHVFETESHPGESGRGLDSLCEIASIPDLTVTAIGGIDERSIAEIARTDVDSVACIRAISRSQGIAATIKTMNEQWKRNQQ